MTDILTVDRPIAETRQVGMATRALATVPASWNADARTIDVVFTTGARGLQFNWDRWAYVDEELSTEAAHVRLERFNGGAPVLNTHSRYALEDQIGVVVPGSARMENGQGVCTVQLSGRESVAPIVADIAAGIIRNLSVGYRVHEYEITERDGERPLYRAVDWEPHEVSFVPVPLDAGAQVRSAANQSEQGGHPCIIRRAPASGAAQLETPTMTDTANAGGGAAVVTRTEPVAPIAPPVAAPPPAARAHAAFAAPAALAFVDMARAFGPTVATRANDLVGQNERDEISIDTAREQLLSASAEAQRAATGAPTGGRAIEMPTQQDQARAEAMAGAILHRLDPVRYQLDAAHRDFRGQSLRTLARSFLESSAISTRGLTDVEVARMAMQHRSAGMHTTSDFPNMLGAVVRRTLRDAYALAPRTYQAWARRVTFTDFRPLTRVSLADAPTLKKVEEHGEYEYGTMGEGAESIRAAKYGRIIAVTWEAIVNDDLDALSRIPQAFGASAAQKESDLAYDALIANANLSDGVSLFHANHGNLAGAGSAISIAALSAGRVALRNQKAPSGAFMSVLPSILLVGPAKELEAYQFTSANYVPVSNGTINPDFNRNLTVVVDPRITDNSWYLIAGPASGVDCVEYGYLDGEDGVTIEERRGFEVDGLEIKARLVFGAGAIEYRGAYKNPGA